MTATDLITSALRLIGVLAAGEQLGPEDGATSLPVLNDMIDGWNADRLAIYTTRADDFALTGNKQAYTLGTGGDFNMTRPASIDSMSVILLNNPTNPVEIPLTEYSVSDWQTKIPVKNVSSSFPQVYYDTGDFPLRTINFWPIPIDTTNKVRIYSWQPLAAVPAFNTTIAFPPGYAEAFRFNLALRLSAEYAAPITPVVQAAAIESMARVKRINTPELNLRSDLMASDGYNWSADMFGNPYQ